MIPKFRAWDVHEKKMFTNAQLIVWNGNVYANDNSELNIDNLKGWSIDEKYLMQSTRLKDKNGREIYEGDIVEMPNEEHSYCGVVVYEKAYGSFAIMTEDRYAYIYTFENIATWYCPLNALEVIGNKYENPELLEGE